VRSSPCKILVRGSQTPDRFSKICRELTVCFPRSDKPVAMTTCVMMPQELLGAPTAMDLDGSAPAQVYLMLATRCHARSLAIPSHCILYGCVGLAASFPVRSSSSACLSDGASTTLHVQVHERVDVECEVSGRYTTSKRQLSSQYADIYYYRLNKVGSGNVPAV